MCLEELVDKGLVTQGVDSSTDIPSSKRRPTLLTLRFTLIFQSAIMNNNLDVKQLQRDSFLNHAAKIQLLTAKSVQEEGEMLFSSIIDWIACLMAAFHCLAPTPL